MFKLNTDTEEIASRFACVAKLTRTIEICDQRARNASTVTEHYSWVMFAANLRTTRDDTLRSIDAIVWPV